MTSHRSRPLLLLYLHSPSTKIWCLQKETLEEQAERRRTRSLSRELELREQTLGALAIIGPPFQVVIHGKVRGIFLGWQYIEARSPSYPSDPNEHHTLKGTHYYYPFDNLLDAEHELIVHGQSIQLGLHTPAINRGSRFLYYAVAIGRASAIVATHQECKALRRGTRSRVRGFNDIFEAVLSLDTGVAGMVPPLTASTSRW